MTYSQSGIKTAISWCLAWGDKREPNCDLVVLQQMRQALQTGREVPEEVLRTLPLQTSSLVTQVKQLQEIPVEFFPKKITELRDKHPELWNQTTRIGLVYGGATKIKQYVFEAAKLQDIRGASAILDRINLVDLPAFFEKEKKSPSISRWLNKHFPSLEAALIPELIIYSTGGNILAFCPAAYVHDLANAIERRYTEETLTANSCAVGDTFRLLEIRFGLLRDSIEETKWLDWYQDEKTRSHPLLEAYYGRPEPGQDWEELFLNRKSFNELVGKLAAAFNKRRSGNDLEDVQRPTRRYPPMFETHPYLQRDESERRNAVTPARLPSEPWFSDVLARKRIVGQRTKREDIKGQQWWNKNLDLRWQVGELRKLWNSGKLESWSLLFDRFLHNSGLKKDYYSILPPYLKSSNVSEARNLEEIAKAQRQSFTGSTSDKFVAYIYADGNNMGGYIQKIKTPEAYQQFSQDIDKATKLSVYHALAKHLQPRKLRDITDPDSMNRNNTWVYPFEIIAIGGDDVLLIVPADKALEIAYTIGEEFEKNLARVKDYHISKSEQNAKSVECHRYRPEKAQVSQCKLSMSMGVLITAYDTPIYYAQKLTEQLLKSAKVRAKDLKEFNYHGGTVDFLVMKSVTMISSKINSYRQEGLTKSLNENQTLKLYAAPYTLHELAGLIETGKALKKSGFPRSQLYQIRSLLEQGKHTAMLNYRYFRVRLRSEEQKLLQTEFENAWCAAKTNNGNLAPWMYKSSESPTYETIWRELVDIYPFIEIPEMGGNKQQLTAMEKNP